MRIAGFATAAAALGTLGVVLFPSPAVAAEENKDWSVQAGVVEVAVPLDREYTVNDREYGTQGTRVTGVTAA
ncbi:hypothetical protein [Spirillospora sp. NPDC047279]|uniref:hypothetical protein n=1 Tax=Spirillospora sp. NPDC047279 TaxID=3155478 RepID=UPI0033E6AE1C